MDDSDMLELGISGRQKSCPGYIPKLLLSWQGS